MHNYTKFHIHESVYTPESKTTAFSMCGLKISHNEQKLINDWESFMYEPYICMNCERTHFRYTGTFPDPPKEYQITIHDWDPIFLPGLSISFDLINEFMGLVKFAIDLDTKFEQGILL